MNNYTADQLKLYLKNNIVKQHFNENWNMSPDDVLSTVESYLTKQRDYFRNYYHCRKNDIGVTNKRTQSKMVPQQ